MMILGDKDVCSICKSSYKEDNSSPTFTICYHKFHSHCLNTCFLSSIFCPICQTKLAMDISPVGTVVMRVSNEDMAAGLDEEAWAGWQEDIQGYLYQGGTFQDWFISSLNMLNITQRTPQTTHQYENIQEEPNNSIVINRGDLVTLTP